MVKKRRGKSVRNNKNAQGEAEEHIQAPHSFVIHKGLPGGNVGELTKDFRRVMEPFTASALKERKKNTIKDFLSIAGPLHVSHLAIFSRTDLGMYLKLARLPRGPTLTFKVQNFTLSRDVVSSLKKQLVIEEAFKHSPLIVLNSFSGEGMQMKLMATMFQNMFPTINLANIDLNTIRRVVLMNYNPSTKNIDFRHYTIKVAPVGISKGVKKVVQGKVPNLSKFEDISDFLTKSALLSESEGEDDPANHIILPQKIISRGNIESGKSAIRLTELGPRLTLQLIKIEDGLLDGEVLYHDLVQKTEEEKAEIQKKRHAKKKLKENRRKVQDENKDKKEAKRQELKDKSMKGMRKETDELMRKAAKESNAENPVADDDDAEYYREEVGQEPEEDLFSKPRPMGTKRPMHTSHYSHNKKPKSDNSASSSTTSSSFNKNKKSSRDKPARPGGGNKKPAQTPKVKNMSFDKKKMKKPKAQEKTNAENRDHRPIGGGEGGGGGGGGGGRAVKTGVRKFGGKKRK